MSTIYSWTAELGADATGQSRDLTLIYDTSTGRTKKATLNCVPFGGSAAGTLGFYGATPVDQGTMTFAAVTALATATISAANSTTVWCWSSSTVAKAYAKRVSQIQADLETFMGKVESTGLVAIAGVP